MSETSHNLFLHWGDYKAESSIDANQISVEVVEAEPFTSTYSTNIRGKVDGIEYCIPLHNLNSANKQLLRDYDKLYKKGKIKNGQQIEILTWMDKSSKNPEYKLRKCRIVP